ncbi:endoribonuclease L-psp family protein [Coprinopsis cinerea okayama7|uniref:Endoribonuclease L-psp family protein n=1 Tax=Coprinopsis cinerea (strain Okayama-7 / 130 / ATCC MYA-4618 / FGSC 9003) TaxID=240176 RepID=A8P9Z2_COPC7|nr:endoribonuclease L-psp family protein [Coprinopsis cinerea okayama7\|eukprot:XP_001839868.1 endoribonuclease L-psp family protein [Coprinopsis cinerea okayama7\
MSHLQYFNYKGFGEHQRDNYWYSQAVRVGDRIECAGQGGWDPSNGKIPADLTEEIDQAFANVELALKTAGGKGWSQVFRNTIYLVDINEEAMQAIVRNFKKWLPDHQPINTLLGVKQLGLPGMRVEIEVVAHVPESA